LRVLLVQPQLRHAPGADNVGTIREHVRGSGIACAPDDLLLLPEHVSMSATRESYEAELGELARALGCHVVGGSAHQRRPDGFVNAGAVFGPDGRVLGDYEKLRPYAAERSQVRPGDRLGEIEVGGRRVLVLVCADFWFVDLVQRARHLPDLIAVPALSVTRRPAPDYSRALWRHLAIARAYELGCYVAVSDWGFPSELPALFTSGVAGLADPTRTEPAELYQALGERSVAAFDLDFDALERFRDDRRERGFFWRPPGA
jgi:predicted amidohydrolase